MKTSTGRITSFSIRYRAMILFMMLAPLFYAKAQSFSPNNVYNGWSTSTQAFATVPSVPGLTFSQFVRGSGLTAPSPVTSGITSSGWNGPTSEAAAVAANKFFTFTITADAATSCSVSGILFSLQRSGTGPGDFQIQSSVNGGPFAAFGSPFSSSVNGTFVQLVTPAAALSVPVGGNVVFRLVGWNCSNSAGTFRINNNTAVNGTYTGAAPTLSTTTVTGAPFCVSSTAGASTAVSYTGTGTFSAGNVFTVQMSDATGSFAAPVAIGSTTSTALSGTINATIPAGTTAGSNYRVRVVASNPAVAGSDNGSDLSVLQGIGLTHTVTNVSCNGAANGAVSVTVSEGSAPYTYAWSNSATTSSVSNLAPGTYSLTITGANGCTGTIASATVTEPAVLTASVTATDISCNAATTGAAALVVNGGTSPYTYAWSNSATTQNISNVAAGTYSVIITDNNSCTQTASVTITQPTAIVTTNSVTNVLCNNAADGAVDLSVSGGISPYTFAWNNSATTEDISGLAAGTYSVIITDNNSCTQTVSVTVTEPNAIVASATATNVLCNGGTNGAVNLSVSGGTSPYTYAWSNSATTQNISNVAAGTYSVIITDNGSCTQTVSVTVTEPNAIVAAATATNVLCNGGTNGAVNLSVSGGTSPYTYDWSNSAATQNISNVAAGTYSVIITDNGSCTQTVSVTVTEPNAIVASATATNVLCNGGTNGAANLSVSGGTSPYTYAWSNSATTQNISNVGAGTYSVIITDNNSCTRTASVTITEPTAIAAAATATDVLCNGATNGAANLSVSGGTAPYTYAWNNSATTQNISNVAAGTYSVIITDNNSCTRTASVTINEPTAITAAATATDVLCNGATNGAANLSVSGGTSPYTYAWSNSATTQNISNVAAGTYSVIITDNNSCTRTASVTVNEPTAITAAATATDVLCNGATNGAANLSVSGGTSPYTYAWSNSATTQNISNLTAGTYSVLITDDNGCTQTVSATVTQPNAIAANTTETDVLCNNGTNGDITLAVNGGTAPYTYAWSNSATTQNISNLAAGTYSVLITDDNGCTQTASATITQPNAMTATMTATDVLCNSGTNGDVTLAVNGGTAPYTYAWNNSATTQNISNLAAGTYSVLVTDDNGCTQTASVTITEPSPISSTLSSTDASCGMCADGSADLTANGGTAPYTYAWSNSAATEDLVNVLPGTYTVVITDNNGCQHTDTVTVNFGTGIPVVNAATGINVYPNPSNGENIFIQLTAGENPATAVFTVYDVTGNAVYTENLVSGNAQGLYRVNVPLTSGVYSFSIVQNDAAYSGQLIIVK